MAVTMHHSDTPYPPGIPLQGEEGQTGRGATGRGGGRGRKEEDRSGGKVEGRAGGIHLADHEGEAGGAVAGLTHVDLEWVVRSGRVRAGTTDAEGVGTVGSIGRVWGIG